MNKWIILWYTYLKICFSVRSWRIGRCGFNRKQDRPFGHSSFHPFHISHLPSPAQPKYSSISLIIGSPQSAPTEILLDHGYLWSSIRIISEKRIFSLLVSEIEPTSKRGASPWSPQCLPMGSSQWWNQSFSSLPKFKKYILTHNICLCYKDTKVYAEGKKPYP